MVDIRSRKNDIFICIAASETCRVLIISQPVCSFFFVILKQLLGFKQFYYELICNFLSYCARSFFFFVVLNLVL